MKEVGYLNRNGKVTVTTSDAGYRIIVITLGIASVTGLNHVSMKPTQIPHV